MKKLFARIPGIGGVAVKIPGQSPQIGIQSKKSGSKFVGAGQQAQHPAVQLGPGHAGAPAKGRRGLVAARDVAMMAVTRRVTAPPAT